MSGPIIRSGPSPEYSNNWDQVFGRKKTEQEQAEPQEPQTEEPAAKKEGGAKKR